MRIGLILKMIFLLHTALFIFVSCEEVIDVDLNSSKPILVADGTIFLDSVAQLRISTTSNYFDNNNSPAVEDAVITLTDGKGTSEQLQHISNGVYLGKKIVGELGGIYSISILINSKTYSAKTVLMPPVEILEVIVKEQKAWSFGRAGSNEIEHLVEVHFSDDPSIENFYLLKYWNNSKEIGNGYFLARDIYAENDVVETNLRTLDFEEGDYKVEVFSIDENTYKYYRQLNEIGRMGMMSATPYNPVSNFGSEVMGYFTALSYSKLEGEYSKEKK